MTLLPLHFPVQVESGLALFQPSDHGLEIGGPHEHAAVEVREDAQKTARGEEAVPVSWTSRDRVWLTAWKAVLRHGSFSGRPPVVSTLAQKGCWRSPRVRTSSKSVDNCGAMEVVLGSFRPLIFTVILRP